MKFKKLIGSVLVGVPFVGLIAYISQVGGSQSLVIALSIILLLATSLFGGLMLAEQK